MNKFSNFIKNIFTYKEKNDYYFSTDDESIPIEKDITHKTDPDKIYDNIDKNLDFLKYKYDALISKDIVIRDFNLIANNKTYKSFIIFIDGMADTTLINKFILEPLMLKIFSNTDNINITDSTNSQTSITDLIYKSLLPQNCIEKIENFSDVFKGINCGNCILFVNSLNYCFNLDVKGFKQRSISSPTNEVVVRGSQESFVENLRTNTSIIRRIVNNENLVFKSLYVRKSNKNSCFYWIYKKFSK